MYLACLKRYWPKLFNCVVTLTEDLALSQAEQAEREIKQGKYRGPLHGIPCGVKDLFATKGIMTTWGAEPFRNQLIDYDARWSSACGQRALCWLRNSLWGHWRRAADGLQG